MVLLFSLSSGLHPHKLLHQGLGLLTPPDYLQPDTLRFLIRIRPAPEAPPRIPRCRSPEPGGVPECIVTLTGCATPACGDVPDGMHVQPRFCTCAKTAFLRSCFPSDKIPCFHAVSSTFSTLRSTVSKTVSNTVPKTVFNAVSKTVSKTVPRILETPPRVTF